MERKTRARHSWPALAATYVNGFVALTLGWLALKLLWDWLLPDLFPALVAQHLVAAALPWATLFKVWLIAILLAAAVFLWPWLRVE